MWRSIVLAGRSLVFNTVSVCGLQRPRIWAFTSSLGACGAWGRRLHLLHVGHRGPQGAERRPVHLLHFGHLGAKALTRDSSGHGTWRLETLGPARQVQWPRRVAFGNARPCAAIPVATARGVWKSAALRRNSSGHGALRLEERGSAQQFQWPRRVASGNTRGHLDTCGTRIALWAGIRLFFCQRCAKFLSSGPLLRL